MKMMPKGLLDYHENRVKHIDKIAKGNRIELMFRCALEKQGYTVWKPSRARFNPNDIFGLFDMICMRRKNGVLNMMPVFENFGYGSLIQIKASYPHWYTARKKIRNFYDGHLFVPMNMGCAIKTAAHTFRVWLLLRDGIEKDFEIAFDSDRGHDKVSALDVCGSDGMLKEGEG